MKQKGEQKGEQAVRHLLKQKGEHKGEQAARQLQKWEQKGQSNGGRSKAQ